MPLQLSHHPAAKKKKSFLIIITITISSKIFYKPTKINLYSHTIFSKLEEHPSKSSHNSAALKVEENVTPITGGCQLGGLWRDGGLTTIQVESVSSSRHLSTSAVMSEGSIWMDDSFANRQRPVRSTYVQTRSLKF